LISDYAESGDEDKIISDCIRIIKNKKIQKNARSIQEKIRSTDVGDEELNKLLIEYQRLKMQVCI